MNKKRETIRKGNKLCRNTVLFLYGRLRKIHKAVAYIKKRCNMSDKYLDLKNFNYNKDDLFGHYAEIEMEFYGEEGNQIHLFKIISSGGQSNFYNDVPFNEHTKPAYLHCGVVDVVKVVECGISEDRVYKVPLKDIRIIKNEADILKEKLEEINKMNFPIIN